MPVHPIIAAVTEKVKVRSATSRARYLHHIRAAERPIARKDLSCTNQAHAWAGLPAHDKLRLRELCTPNIGIVTAYNDILSAHQPYAGYPEILKAAARAAGATAQVAGGVPAMCDGVTQGQPGMELSLFSRDVIAMSTAVALSHNLFDAVLCLGICDKIVPGLLIGALSFGQLPTIFVPAGPMPSGISNSEKSKIRQLYAQHQINDDALLASEEKAYHSPGTCTFYGTANSNQMLMEIMGLHLPGAAFIHPSDPLRHALTVHAVYQAIELKKKQVKLGEMIDESVIINAIVGLLATGGSTNHTIHLVAIARAAGIHINWSDFHDLSQVVPLLARMYPNGDGDVNQFHSAGGMAFLIRELLSVGLLHEDVQTVVGRGLAHYAQTPVLAHGELIWHPPPAESRDESILRLANEPFALEGGLRLLTGNLGRAIIKISAVKPECRRIEAPALLFNSQKEVLDAFDRGELDRDCAVILRFQGPRANGMPELHKLTPALSVVQEKGFKIALITDGRMSGASGKVPAAIHITPEVHCGGPLGRVRHGDRILLDAEAGILNAQVDPEEWKKREIAQLVHDEPVFSMGRALFSNVRAQVSSPEEGASILGWAI